MELVYSEVFEDKVNALKREYEIKKMSRNEKIRLLKEGKK